MEIIQILIILFAIFAFSRSFLRLREKAITKAEFLFWTLIWSLVIIIALLPGLTNFFSKPLGIGRGIDIIVYVSIILLFYLCFRLYVKTEQNNRDLTRLVREIAKERKSDFENKTKK